MHGLPDLALRDLLAAADNHVISRLRLEGAEVPRAVVDILHLEHSPSRLLRQRLLP